MRHKRRSGSPLAADRGAASPAAWAYTRQLERRLERAELRASSRSHGSSCVPLSVKVASRWSGVWPRSRLPRRIAKPGSAPQPCRATMVPPIMRLAAIVAQPPAHRDQPTAHPVADPVAGVAADQHGALLHAGWVARQGGTQEVAGIGGDVDACHRASWRPHRRRRCRTARSGRRSCPGRDRRRHRRRSASRPRAMPCPSRSSVGERALDHAASSLSPAVTSASSPSGTRRLPTSSVQRLPARPAVLPASLSGASSRASTGSGRRLPEAEPDGAHCSTRRRWKWNGPSWPP